MSGYEAYPEYRDSEVDSVGEIPAGWTVSPLKHMASIKNGSDYKHVETDVGYPVMGSGGRFTYASAYMYDKPSVLLGRKGTIDRPLFVNEPFWSVDTMYYTEINEDIPPRFLYYCALTIQFDKFTTNTALPSMTQESLGNYPFPLPEAVNERSRIASFLDHETAKIDTLIEKQQQLIKLLKEKRQGVISHAVTKGLNPDAPMKDSGVEWLGEVPAGWDVSQAKYIAKAGTQITYGIVQAGPHVKGGVPYIKTGDMSGEELSEHGYSRTSIAIDDAYSRSRVEAGDMVVAIRATLGKCLLVPNALAGANLTQGTAKISPGDNINSQFMLNYFSCSQVQQYIDSVAKGSTFREITLDMLRRIPFLVPSLSEQDDIDKFLLETNSKYRLLMLQCGDQIELLKERRTALISAAVTGKIDVRNWQAPESTSIPSMDA